MTWVHRVMCQEGDFHCNSDCSGGERWLLILPRCNCSWGFRCYACDRQPYVGIPMILLHCPGRLQSCTLCILHSVTHKMSTSTAV